MVVAVRRRLSRRLRLALTGQLLALSVSCVAFGQLREGAAAEALFRAGREASERGDHATACLRFEESYRLDPVVGTLLNWAACEEAQQRLASAWERYRHVAERLSPGDDRAPLVQQRIGALDSRLARLILNPRAGVQVGDVERDGVKVNAGAFGVALPLDPGEHHVTVRAPNRAIREYVVVLGEGDRLALEIEPGELLPEAVPAPSPTLPVVSEPPTSSPPVAGYALLGAGIAALVSGGVAGVAFLERRTETEERCPTPSSCDDAGLRAAGAADRLRFVTLVSAGVGVAALGAGIVLLAIHPDADAPRKGATLRISPMGLSAEGRF